MPSFIYGFVELHRQMASDKYSVFSNMREAEICEIGQLKA